MLGQIKFKSYNPECRKLIFPPQLACVCVRHTTLRASSNNNVNKMRLPALPKLPQCCCSHPLNSAAISAIQSNQSGWGWERGYHRSKICTAIFSEIIAYGGLIRNLGNFKTPVLGADAAESQSVSLQIAEGVNDVFFFFFMCGGGNGSEGLS